MEKDSIFEEDMSIMLEREMKKLKPMRDTEKEYDSTVIWLDDADKEDIEELKKEGIL